MQKSHHHIESDLAPKDAPDSSISGTNIMEKLKDIYFKNILFHLHISKVEEYQKVDIPAIVTPLREVKNSLHNKLSYIETLFKNLNSLPSTPAPPHLPSDIDDYTKKIYGWGVIVKLNEWLVQVPQVVEEAKELCKQTAWIQLLKGSGQLFHTKILSLYLLQSIQLFIRIIYSLIIILFIYFIVIIYVIIYVIHTV